MVFVKDTLLKYSLLNLIDKITEEVDNKKTVVTIFINLSKAFDTIDYDILLSWWNPWNCQEMFF